jgi:hypothetical protein
VEYGSEVMRYVEKAILLQTWTINGASISSTWITCASMSACAATASAIR